jgi:phosphate uptake regulator
METRKVQVTGGSTYTVSLPKGWATEQDVSGGSVVELYPEDETLLISPREHGDLTEGRLNVAGLSPVALERAVTTMYVSGFDVVALEAPRMGAERRRAIRRAADRLIGFEVVEETEDVVQLRDLLDPGELPIDDAVSRTSVLSTAMVEDAVDALLTGDTELAVDVAARDDDVDRLHALVVRTFRTALRDPRAATTLGVDGETCFDHQQCSRQYERVADHAEKVASVVEAEPVGGPVAERIEGLRDEAVSVVRTATEAFFATDADEAIRLADGAREANGTVSAHAREADTAVRELETGRARDLALVVDSLSRVGDYGGNVAEVALQRAYPTP